MTIEAAPSGQAAGGSAPAEQSAWFGTPDEQTLGYLQSKGWDKPDAGPKVIKSYMEAEKLITMTKASPERLVVMPKDFADQNEVNDFYSKLGRPESPDKYSFKVEGNDFTAKMAEIAHKYGLNDSQYSGFAKDLAEATAQRDEAYKEQVNEITQKEMTEVKNEWGNAYDAKLLGAKQAAQALGIMDDLDMLEAALGPKKMLTMLAGVAEKIGESKAVGLGENASFGTSPAQAKAEITKLNNDPEFVRAYTDPQHPKHQASKEQMAKLFKDAYPS